MVRAHGHSRVWPAVALRWCCGLPVLVESRGAGVVILMLHCGTTVQGCDLRGPDVVVARLGL